jgi:DNA mismatch repair protein MutL
VAGSDDWIFAGQGAAADRVGEGPDDAPSSRMPAATGQAAEALGTGTAEAPGDEPRPPVPSFGALRPLGQLRASYLLAEGDQGLMVVDQHAAHERILYERLRSGWLASGVARQGLLVPVPVSLPPRAVAALEEEGEIAARLGFEIEGFGEDAVLVRAIPAELAGEDVEGLVRELASALSEVERAGEADADATRWLPSLDRLFATLACHAARRFGDRLPEPEQRAILEGLDAIPWAPTCPHGRPVAILIRPEELEQRFRRR